MVHNIRSVYNVGAIFRTADAFGVSKVYLTGYTPIPENIYSGIKISKTALGSEKFVPWEYCKSPLTLINKMKKQGVRVVALENHKGKSIQIKKFKPKFPLLLILGEEVGGVDEFLLKKCSQIVEIPMLGKKESLNVSVAFGIMAFWIAQF